jgi:hypothetical protein
MGVPHAMEGREPSIFDFLIMDFNDFMGGSYWGYPSRDFAMAA